MALTTSEIRALALQSIKGPTVRLSESEAAERIEAIRAAYPHSRAGLGHLKFDFITNHAHERALETKAFREFVAEWTLYLERE
jgi:hypothetical protein